ncbi:arsenate reductase, glutathione/glutaredoxin type [Acaryochloris sp. IP29b_bin.148]|uniref:arsenate reductase, glutathione/glutaredoxin type n=1 Tax=Acaryochloris sp. IP29b_bin.148 TaxID=2969218 RepID=UPI0026081A59|nr:arsenate reductase, glutathione/glutaredoxin type [Acaryochloris sp. IP29b_bin.148]
MPKNSHSQPQRIMFVCKHNSRRSHMAEGFARSIAGETIEVASAGIEASHVDPLTVRVMQEVGIDIRCHTSNALEEFDPETFDAVISLCGCGVHLPEVWVTRPLFADWQLDDPAGQSVEVFRHIRTQVEHHVTKLVHTLLSHQTLR